MFGQGESSMAPHIINGLVRVTKKEKNRWRSRRKRKKGKKKKTVDRELTCLASKKQEEIYTYLLMWEKGIVQTSSIFKVTYSNEHLNNNLYAERDYDVAHLLQKN